MSFHRPLIMGVLNVTPDSFSDGGLSESTADIIAQAMQPVRLREDDGTYSYFDLAQEVRT